MKLILTDITVGDKGNLKAINDWGFILQFVRTDDVNLISGTHVYGRWLLINVGLLVCYDMGFINEYIGFLW